MMRQAAIFLDNLAESNLRDPSNTRLLAAARRFSECLGTLGYSVRDFSKSALEKLSEISAEKKEQIASDFESWSQWIGELDPAKPDESSKTLLARVLEKEGFIADEEFLKTIEPNQIVEIYDENMIQLFRSFNFYEITGYSLGDISTHEWYVLWDRSRQILESIASELNEALRTYVPVKKFVTPKHVVREIYNASGADDFEQRAALLTPIRLGSLKPKKIGARKGFICTSSGEKIAVGKEAQNIQFI